MPKKTADAKALGELTTEQVARVYVVLQQLRLDRKSSPLSPWQERPVPRHLQPVSERERIVEREPLRAPVPGRAKTRTLKGDIEYLAQRVYAKAATGQFHNQARTVNNAGSALVIGQSHTGTPLHGSVLQVVTLLATSPRVLESAVRTRNRIAWNIQETRRDRAMAPLLEPMKVVDSMLPAGLPRDAIEMAIKDVGDELMSRTEVRKSAARAMFNPEHPYARTLLAGYHADAGPEIYERLGVGTEALVKLPLDPHTVAMTPDRPSGRSGMGL